MRPFFLLYGGKWRISRVYGPPRYPQVIEPFAGGAGYSVYWEPKHVTLIERDPLIAGLWKYLIKAKPGEILSIPTNVDCRGDLHHQPQEAKPLVGFWFDRARTEPAQQ